MTFFARKTADGKQHWSTCATAQARPYPAHLSLARRLGGPNRIVPHADPLACNPSPREFIDKRFAHSYYMRGSSKRPAIHLVISPHFQVGGHVPVMKREPDPAPPYSRSAQKEVRFRVVRLHNVRIVLCRQVSELRAYGAIETSTFVNDIYMQPCVSSRFNKRRFPLRAAQVRHDGELDLRSRLPSEFNQVLRRPCYGVGFHD